eukprot:TRINITY_DN24520_c0_g1_i1.p2 TRINITY_DN24520_c0_g1~~TRINITY_DN24520_c0_g1_i1.p2  ORF type:complete len:107 (+),score=1.83 TRINITY_DN24520_c0_g1_i1:71-391(+)
MVEDSAPLRCYKKETIFVGYTDYSDYCYTFNLASLLLRLPVFCVRLLTGDHEKVQRRELIQKLITCQTTKTQSKLFMYQLNKYINNHTTTQHNQNNQNKNIFNYFL